MRYVDGQAVEVGDKADLGGGMTGVVVAIISQGRYSPDFRMEDWNFLREGVLVNSSEAGLVHFSDKIDKYIELISRA